jgi:hypothetical protein
MIVQGTIFVRLEEYRQVFSLFKIVAPATREPAKIIQL